MEVGCSAWMGFLTLRDGRDLYVVWACVGFDVDGTVSDCSPQFMLWRGQVRDCLYA